MLSKAKSRQRIFRRSLLISIFLSVSMWIWQGTEAKAGVIMTEPDSVVIAGGDEAANPPPAAVTANNGAAAVTTNNGVAAATTDHGAAAVPASSGKKPTVTKKADKGKVSEGAEPEKQEKEEHDSSVSMNEISGADSDVTPPKQTALSSQITSSQVISSQETSFQETQSKLSSNQFELSQTKPGQNESDQSESNQSTVNQSTANQVNSQQVNLKEIQTKEMPIVPVCIIIYGISVLIWLFLTHFRGGKGFMKKRQLLAKFIGIFSCFMFLFMSIPIQAWAEESDSVLEELEGVDMINDTNTATDMEVTDMEEAEMEEEAEILEEALSETEEEIPEEVIMEEEAEIPEESETEYKDATEVSEWRNMSEEELNLTLGNASWEEIGAWLQSLSEDELQTMLQKDTILTQEVTVTDYSFSCEGESGESALIQEGENRSTTLWEYALSNAATAGRARVSFVNSSGGYSYQFVKDGQTFTVKYTITGVETKTSTTASLTGKVSKVEIGTNFIGFASNAGTDNLKFNFKRTKDEKGNDTGKTYYLLQWGFSFYKPVNYRVSYTLKNQGISMDGNYACAALYWRDGGDWVTKKRYYSNDNLDDASLQSLIAETNAYYCAGLGNSGGGTAKQVTYLIQFTPCNYTVYYNGNGATGGGINAQTCRYGTTYMTAANAFTRAYTVNFNGNGGTTSQSSATAVYGFKGWGLNNAGGVTHYADQKYSNLSKTNGDSRTFYAIWNPKGVTLPGAERIGYQFKGWNTNPAAASGSPKGSVYTPNAPTTLYAIWKANSYTINYNGNGATAGSVPDQICSYGTTYKTQENKFSRQYAVNYNPNGGNMNENEKSDTAVYNFSGWGLNHAETKTHDIAEEFHNITDINGGKASFYAIWSPTEVVLPKVLRNGYEFMGWSENKDALSGMAAGDAFSPEKDTTLYAIWVPEPKPFVNQTSPVDNNAKEKSSQVTNHYYLYAGDTRVYKDESGNAYQIYMKEDGTLKIVALTGKSGENLSIQGTLMIDGTKYQVTEIAANAFKKNKKIKKVTIGNGITKIGKSAFEGCTNLKTVKLGTSVEHIELRAFYGCTKLESIKTNKTLTTIGSKAFYNCKKLKSYTIGKYVKSIGSYAFYNCKALKKLTVSESVEVIGKKAFYGCSKLAKVSIKSTRLIKVGSGAFKKCSRKLKVTVPKKKEKAYRNLLKGKF